jgi:alpha-glucosidase
MTDHTWWQDSLIYQIYPRSFADGNDDGIGDLPGIIAHLDHLADLGIGAIWLSPIHPSPNKDFGYDVSDYCSIDPVFGTMSDFDHLVTWAHQLGIRIILDMVMNHTSDQHAWFKESRSSRLNPKQDWYIWRDHPNNWQSWFGGRAWEYDAARGQYYLHSFAKEQPDLNWRNPEVRKELLNVFRFWLERGVDGFRLDVFNSFFKHPDLADNPFKLGIRAFYLQHHINDMDQPEMLPLLGELRSLLDSYPDRYAVGETHLPTLQKAVSYCGPDRLHAAFSFDFTSSNFFFPWNPRWLKRQIERREAAFTATGIWPTTVMSNHDLPRAAGRYARGEEDTQARIAMTLLLTLRGTPFMYYGEEIGMRDIRLRRSEILDPPGQRYWPLYKGRDGCRAPMQWNARENAGFSSAAPWLPVQPDHVRRNVAAQQEDPDSFLNFTRKLIGLRKEFPALRNGEYVPLVSPNGSLVYLRKTPDQSVLVAINFTSRWMDMQKAFRTLTPPQDQWRMLCSSRFGQTDPTAHLGPHEVRILVHEEKGKDPALDRKE